VQDFYSFSRRKKGRIASYVTLFTTQKMGKKTSKLGIFFAGNRLSYHSRHLITNWDGRDLTMALKMLLKIYFVIFET